MSCVRTHLDRRTFIKSSAAAFAVAALPDGMGAMSSRRPIADISLDLNRIHKWDRSNGDTWDPFLADDGDLYAFNCDGRGFGAGKAYKTAPHSTSFQARTRMR